MQKLLISFIVFLLISTGLLPDWTEQQKILASDGEISDWFGYSVALDGDYAVVGASHNDENGSNSGSAYIFQKIGTTWSEQTKITASDGTDEDRFGYSVSKSGDYAVIGTSWDDDNGIDSGSAYIFQRIGTNWIEQVKITASDGAAYEEFGVSVSISEDYVVIGAWADEDNGTNSGSAYIFHRIGTTWSEQAKITASDGAAFDCFGSSVSIDGDYAVIGAGLDDDNGDWSGSAYIFHRDGTTWSEQAKLTASDGAAEDYFGGSVSISGDYAVIGAVYDDDNGDGSGFAYIFHRNGTTWSEQVKITASDGIAYDHFGYSVSIDGNYVVISAFHDDDNGSYSGSAYVFQKIGTTWYEQAKITASDGAAADFFGYSVSISGDYAVIGAFRDDDNGEDSGSAYIFYNDGLSIDENEITPINTSIIGNYPNPFNRQTTIKFSIKENDTAELSIYNVKGQKIVSENFTEGIHQYKWNADKYASGIYFYKLQTEDYSKISKMILFR